MGNNKRKASLIVLTIIVAALAVFPFFLDVFVDNAGVRAETAVWTSGKTSYSGDGYSTSTYNKTIDLTGGGTILVIAAGQDGSGGTGYGYGAVCLGFSKSNSSLCYIGGQAGDGYYYGGGYTDFYSNLALPSGTSSGWGKAAGGGGGYGTHGGANTSWNPSANITPYTGWTNASFGGYSGTLATGVEYDYTGGPAMGASGKQGKKGSTDRATSKSGASREVRTYNNSYKTITSSGGGNGAYAGGGGGYYVTDFSSYANDNVVLKCFPGGGGQCSSNLYPIYGADCALGVKSTGKGWLKAYQISPTTVPYIKSRTDSKGVLDETANVEIVDPGTSLGTNVWSIAAASKDCFGTGNPVNDSVKLGDYIATDWVYSYRTQEAGKDWSAWSGYSTSAPTLTTAACKIEVKCKYVIYAVGDTTKKNPCYNMQYKSATDAGADTNDSYTVKTVTLSATKKKEASWTVEPKAATGLVWNGDPKTLISNTPKSITGSTAVYGGIYIRNADGTLSSTYDAFSDGKPSKTAPGTYFVDFHIPGDDFYVKKYWGGFDVTISKADPGLTAGTLYAIDRIYNGSSQQMFSGSASRSGDGQVYYYCNTSSSTAPNTTNTGGYSPVNFVADVVDNGYYLWYRVAAGTNHAAAGWRVLKDANGNPISAKIKPAELMVTPTLMAECAYDGKSHNFITDVEYKSPNKSTKSNLQNDFDIYYDVTNSYGGDSSGKNKETSTRTYKNGEWSGISGIACNNFSVSVRWEPKSTVIASNYKSGSSGPYTSKIKRISDVNKIQTVGLTLIDEKELKLDYQGECTPFASSAVDLIVCEYEADNYITNYDRANDVCDDGLTPVNHLSFCFSQSPTAPTDASDYKTAKDPAELNAKILAEKVTKVGKWYVYFNVVRHYNLEPGTKFKGSEFNIGGMVITNEYLGGITMQGANANTPKDGSATFNGSPFVVVKDTTATLTSTVATFDKVEYAIGTSATGTPSSSSSDWKDTLAELPTKTEKGNYYLFVRWNASDNVAANAGLLYGEFIINPYNAANANTYFSGHDFKSTWGEPTTSANLQYYSQVFKNGDYQYGTLSNFTASVKGTSIKSSEFGTFEFALAKSSDDIPTSGWVTQQNFGNLKMKNVGTYWLRIKWTGGDNVDGTSTGIPYAYMMQGTSTICNPVFQITTLTANDNVTLAHQRYAESLGSIVYKYDVNGGHATSVSQPAFANGDQALQIKINNNAYNLLADASGKTTWEIYYLTSEFDTVDKISIDSPNWKKTLNEATVTQAGTYYLYVKVVAKDANINIARVYKFAGAQPTCIVQPAESYVEYTPTIRDDLKYNLQPQKLLSAGSTQTSPRVQYSLDNGVSWLDNWEDVQASSEGYHTVLCRGYPTDTKNFVVQTSGFSQVQIQIKPSSDQDVYYATYSEPKSTNGVVYTGKPIPTASLFNIGYAQVQGNSEIPLYYRWEDDNNSSQWYYYANLPLKTNVGTYVCIYKPDTAGHETEFGGAKEQKVTVQITKATIQVGSLFVSQNDLPYKVTDYELLLQAMDYGMYNTYGTLKNPNNVDLTYKNYLEHGTNLSAGTMGTLYYGVSKSSNITPSTWETDYFNIKARTVGDYYIWTKVDGGDNHQSLGPKCHNIGDPIKIVPVDLNSGDYAYDNIYVNQSTYSVNKGSTGTGLRYNGLLQSLISSFDLIMIIADRNNEGEVLLRDGNNETATPNSSSTVVKYNNFNRDDNIGTIYYAIVKKGANYPADDDYSDSGWSLNYETLQKVDADKFDFVIRFKPDTNSNIASDIKFRISAMDTWDGSTRDTIQIAPAVKDELVLSGYFKEDKMFDGNPQIITKAENSSGLSVKHKYTGANFTDVYNNQIIDQKYCYVRKGDLAPTLDAQWTDFENAKVLEVGEYQLYVKLITTSNIDYTIQPLIYPLLGENYAQITRVNESGITVVNPVYVNGLVYNGLDQNLISQAAYLKMTNGTVLVGQKGAITYYISSSSTEINKTGTTKNGQAYAMNNVKELHAGTYYIWAQFAQGESHTAMGPFYVGSVSIAQATHENIKLSNLEFNRKTYNGEEHALINTKVKQIFITGGKEGKELNGVDDYAKLEYAYSSSHEGLEGGTVWVEEANLAQFKARNAGSYYVWLRVTGFENSVTGVKDVVDFIKCYSDTEFALIERATLSNDNIEGVLSHRGLVYIAQSQALASIPNKLKLILSSTDTDLNTDTYNRDLSINWGLGESRKTEPTKWFTDIDSIDGTDHDTYYLWIWIPESANVHEHKVCFDEIYIDKATLHIIQEPGIYTDLIYNGNYQNLLSTAPIIKYYAVGTHYDKAVPYYDANAVAAEYRNTTSDSDWSNNLADMKGLDAITYKVHYRVPEAANWYLVEDDIEIIISPVDASTELVGLVEAPRAYTELAYNENEQDLVFFGLMSDDLPVAGCGAALEGCQIVFYYADDEYQKQYKYYYDVASGEYVWDPFTGKLPGRVNVGEYHIRYFVTESTKTGNFKASAVEDLYITIERREVYWEVRPQSIYGLKFTSNEQPILVAGRLNVGETNPCVAKGVTIKYTLDDPNAPVRNWQESIPVVDTPDLWYVWYRVEVDENNIFVGTENNDPEMGEMIVVLIERHVLAIRDLPRPYETIEYTAEEQSLIEYYFLSTDDVRDLGENAPYFEYSFSKFASDEDWVRDIKAKDVGEYTIYYRLNYDDALFEFRGENDGREDPMQLTIAIEAVELNFDSISALYVEDENGGYLTYKAAQYESFNPETQEYEYIPMYSDTLLKELESYMQYFYRRGDQYSQDVGWLPWADGTVINDLGIGSYQFMLRIVGDENANFKDYAQMGGFNTYTNKEDRVVEIIMQDYNTPAYVRAWIDFTTSMTYEESAFKFEGWVGKNGRLEIPFFDVDSTGRYNGAVIRLQTVNASYYYMSQDALSKDNKLKIELKSSDVKNVVKSFNPGLIHDEMKVYLYEVYRIQYDANGGIGDNLTEGWKWHKIDYLLAENKFSKTENGEVLVANGWNTSKAGNGTNYSSGAMYYREDASQIFYAKFFASGENYYTVKWIIDNGSKRYALSRDFNVWFDTSIEQYQSRDTGVLVAEGDLITLPQIQVDENGKSLSSIFGGYILGWYTEEENIPYSIGMTATRNVTFVAELNFDINDYVQCKFLDEENEEIHYSGLVANGAQAYMALSGMDANLIKDYNDGYQKWVSQYAFEYLDSTGKPDGVLEFNLGTKEVVDDAEPKEEVVTTWNDYVSMLVILGIGVAAAVISLSVYIIMRKKHKQVI